MRKAGLPFINISQPCEMSAPRKGKRMPEGPFKVYSLLLVIAILLTTTPGFGQRSRAQYPVYLSRACFSVNVGFINYPFTNEHMEPGFVAESITIPHTAVRLSLYGWQFSDYLSMHISYMRPILWVNYHDINGERNRKSVWMNIAGLTAVPQLPLSDRFSVFGEFGLSIITRNGFHVNHVTAMRDVSYASILLGSGFTYRLGGSWELMVHGGWTPANKKARQPYSTFFFPGIKYRLSPLSEEKVAANTNPAIFFPKNQIQLGISTNAFGYGVNAFFSEGTIPVFWGGNAVVERGIALSYMRNVFHGRKIFALDFGAAVSYFETDQVRTPFYTLAIFPVLRFTPLRTRPADFFFFYSAAGPTYISKALIDGVDTGKRFTFHDFMGIGMVAGKNRTLSAEIKIGHYSNGNLFPQNAGVKIPLTFALGYNF